MEMEKLLSYPVSQHHRKRNCEKSRAYNPPAAYKIFALSVQHHQELGEGTELDSAKLSSSSFSCLISQTLNSLFASDSTGCADSPPFEFSFEWHFWCFTSTPLCLNLLPHTRQRYGFSPVWIRWCVIRSDSLVNLLSHSSQG